MVSNLKQCSSKETKHTDKRPSDLKCAPPPCKLSFRLPNFLSDDVSSLPFRDRVALNISSFKKRNYTCTTSEGCASCLKYIPMKHKQSCSAPSCLLHRNYIKTNKNPDADFAHKKYLHHDIHVCGKKR